MPPPHDPAMVAQQTADDFGKFPACHATDTSR